MLSSNGLFKNTQSVLASQASKAVFKLRKSLYKFKNVPLSLALDLFDKLINPILNYASEVWGFHDAPEIERVHLSFCRVRGGLNSNFVEAISYVKVFIVITIVFY